MIGNFGAENLGEFSNREFLHTPNSNILSAPKLLDSFLSKIIQMFLIEDTITNN